MESYTLGLFANMYPAFEGDYRGIFIQRMVQKLESKGVIVKKAVKQESHMWGYVPFYADSLRLSFDSSIDILQAHYIPHSSIIPALFKQRKPLVLKFHGDDGRIYPFENVINQKIIQKMIKKADHLITTSNEIREKLIILGAAPEKVTPISSGVDTHRFSPVESESARNSFNFPSNSQIFLYVGRIHPWKGISEIISVARVHPDSLFVIAGPGKIPAHPDNCRFLGEISAEKMPALINAADVALLPSYTEGISNFIMESLSCGIPVIASNVGGNPEVIQHEKTGLLIPVKDNLALSKAISWMKENTDERKVMGKRGRVEMITHYDDDLLINRLMGIHRCLMQ
jgi:teichuronic acid biosynthesis glycosyltransferase TuaC